MKRKILILLSALIIIFAVPLIASAQIIDSGSCGANSDNVTWTLDDEGTLTISGTGDMGYYLMVNPPWRNYFSDIKNLVIDDGVTNIGAGAFQHCENLTNITIADSVTSIGERAFGDSDFGTESGYYSDETNWENGVLYIDNCLIDSKPDINECEIKDNCKVIADLAFHRCSQLRNVTIPKGMRNIGEEAFYMCDALAEITIPDSVETVGFYAFKDTGYYNNESNWEGNLLYLNHCLVGAKDNISGECDIKDSCKIIAGGVFKECDYTSIIIPDSVTYIGSYAFQGCRSLTSIIIPNGVTKIDEFTFEYCTGLVSVSIPDSVTSIGEQAFHCCFSLASVDISDGLRSIGSSAFSYCEDLTSITIPDSVEIIEDGSFTNCGSLNINVEANNAVYCDIDGVLFNKEKTELLRYAKDKIQPIYTIPNGVTSIGIGAFRECNSLTSVTISNGVTSIGDQVFYSCMKLTSITIPDSVTSIGMRAFEYTEYYNNNDNWENGVLYIGNYLIDSKNQEPSGDYTINAGTKVIADAAFSGCVGLTSIKLPYGLISIGDSAFKNNYNLTSIDIPNNVTSIGEGAFYYCSSLTDVYYSGSKTEWENIDIDDRENNPLFTATIHYGRYDPITPAALTVVQSGNSYVLTAETDYDGDAYAASYDAEGALISVVSEPFADGTATVAPDMAGAAKIKFFVWTNSVQPVTLAREITLN